MANGMLFPTEEAALNTFKNSECEIYRHYKGGLYWLINSNVGSASEYPKRKVYYVCLWTPFPDPNKPMYWERDYDEFFGEVNEIVEEKPYPCPRFSKLKA